MYTMCTMNRKKFHQILKRYVQGKSSDAENALVDQWYELLDDENILQMDTNEIEIIADRVWGKIASKTQVFPIAKFVNNNKKAHWIVWMQRIAVAAIFIGLMVVSVIYWTGKKTEGKISYVPQLKIGLTEEKVNNTQKPLKLELEDGSVVLLQLGAKISYPSHFLPNRREVVMDGEIYFEVTRNINRPFYVYHKNIITHVLGTSFTIKSYKNKSEVEVSVRTGRVEVYENREGGKDNYNKSNGVVLTPNQKVLYNEDSRQFVASLVDSPLPVPVADEYAENSAPAPNFVFDEAPLSVVLRSLEKMYGIEIVVENEAIYNCPFSGDISQQNLYTKLDIINQVLKTSYEVLGTKILIKGRGCN